MDETYRKPVPEITADTRPYWDGLADKRLMLQRCAECGKVRHYPRPVCDACWSMNVEWIEASGQGTVYSWTVTHHPFHPGFADELPFTLVTVDLAEGVRLNAQARNIAIEQLRIGLKVRIGFEHTTAAFSLPVVLAV